MAGTTTSSGLNNALSSTNQVQTTLPSWMDTAQQAVIQNAGAANTSAPAFSSTTAQNAVNTLQGSNNPFTQAQGALNTIASGAANPWITDPTTGAVTPNTNTAMGGLFAAQENQLNQTLPELTAGTEAGAIGSGNFGSLRGQTAVDMARGDALANLQAQQMTAAVQNQQAGASAAGALGNIGAQGTSADLTTGAAQMNAPFQNATNYANLVNSVNAPTTVSTQNQMSPLTMLGSVGSAGSGLLNSLLPSGVPGTSGYVPGALNQLQSLYNQITGNTSTPIQNLTATNANFGTNGATSGITSGGVTGNNYDANGNLISSNNAAPTGVTGDPVASISTVD
jgi:hypothetical protein